MGKEQLDLVLSPLSTGFFKRQNGDGSEHGFVLNASNVAVDMCRSVTISDRNFFVATSDILLLRTWLITKGSVVDSRCFMADIRTDYWPRLSFDSSPVIIESVKYQSKLIYYTNKRNHSKWLEFTKSAKMSSWIWFGIVIGCLTAERISKTTRKLFDSTSSLKRNSGMTSRDQSCAIVLPAGPKTAAIWQMTRQAAELSHQ